MAAIGAVLPGAVIACNGIIGLSDFEKGECPGNICGTIEGGSEGGEGGPDSGDAGGDVAKGADPTTWARWIMPNYKADASVRAPIPQPFMTYTVQGAGAVQDDTTKLVWQTDPRGPGNGADFPFTDAQTQCQMLGSEWRLPKRIELVSLLSYGHAADAAPSAFIDNGTFPKVGGKVWTSSPLRPVVGGAAQQYWIVDFDTGAVGTRPGSQGAKALCVRGK